jgi:hypothetical protein
MSIMHKSDNSGMICMMKNFGTSQMWIGKNFNVSLASHKVCDKASHGIHCFIHSNPYKGIFCVTSYVFQGFFIADRQIMFSKC